MVKSASNPKSGATTEGGLPLFFRKPMPLDARRHSKAGLLPTEDFTFAAETNSILINAVEFFEAAKHYPIVFTMSEAPLPAVIVGLEKENYFVDSNGKWKESAYIPAYVRKYPFVFMDVPERNEFLLCVDESAPQYKESGGKGTLPLYQDKEPSELSRNALEFCTAYHNHHQFTRRFCEELQASGLLMPMRSDAKLASGREIHLAGFQSIDEKKLMALPEEKVYEYFKKGWLPLIYIALMSAGNWKKLADVAGVQEKARAN